MSYEWPLQTDNNCTAYSYWAAMRVALELADPLRKIDFTPQQVQACIGAPASTNTPDVLTNLRATFVNYQFAEAHNTTYRTLPIVVACWDQGIAHAVCLLPNRDGQLLGYAYDPAYGNTDRAVDVLKTARAVEVTCLLPHRFAYLKWYYKFAIVRKLLRELKRT